MRAANHVSVSQACRAAARELSVLKCQVCGEGSTYVLVVTFHSQADATKSPTRRQAIRNVIVCLLRHKRVP